MKYKTYRICLLSLLILAVVGGIFYYRNMEENQVQAADGTFVKALPGQVQDLSAMEAVGNGISEYLAGQEGAADAPAEIMDAFCRKVAGWEEYTDGEAYGGR